MTPLPAWQESIGVTPPASRADDGPPESYSSNLSRNPARGHNWASWPTVGHRSAGCDVRLPPESILVFFSYSHRDEELRDELAKHLSDLQRQGVIAGWHDRMIGTGTHWEGAIHEHLNQARIILLLFGANFLASDYCYEFEALRALERHKAGEAVVIPIILRAADWTQTPFARLQALPKDLRPIASWPNHDEAFASVARSIRAVADAIRSGRLACTAPRPARPSADGPVQSPTGAAPVRRPHVRPATRRRRPRNAVGRRLPRDASPPLARRIAPGSIPGRWSGRRRTWPSTSGRWPTSSHASRPARPARSGSSTRPSRPRSNPPRERASSPLGRAEG